MKLYTCQSADGNSFVAVSFSDSLYDLAQFGVHVPDMQALIDNFTEIRPLLVPNDSLTPLDASALRLCAPIPYPRQDIICLGINYTAHAEEADRFDSDAFGGERPKAIYFSKRACPMTGDGDPIPSYPGLVTRLDYECELGVVIGKDAFQVAPEQAADYIFGYTIINDVSARNLQTAHKQWYFGKSLDGFTPCGPCIVTADDIPFPPALSIRCTVNGELRQDSNTAYLINSIASVIAELSQGMTLRAGTIIATGTPAGVGMGLEPPQFLKTGDTVVCEIEGIGTLTNVVD